MADLVTHALTVALIRGRHRIDAVTLWLVTGAILPDLLSRAPFVALRIIQNKGFISGLSLQDDRLQLGLNLPHTPAGIILVSVLVSVVLPQWLTTPLPRLRLAGWIAIGGLLHLGVDLLQLHLADGYFLFYPFSVQAFEFGLVRSDGSVLVLPVLVALYALIAAPSLKAALKRSAKG
jgi:hypothetical protein